MIIKHGYLSNKIYYGLKMVNQFKIGLFIIIVICILSYSNLVLATATYLFPDFETEGDWIDGEYVYQMDSYNGVPSYLNAKNNGTGNDVDSYYQCTEYVVRYLHTTLPTILTRRI